jgi:hypothetical protein
MLAKVLDYAIALAIAIGLAKALDYWWFFQP